MKKRLVQIGFFIVLLLAIAVGIYYRDNFNVEVLQQWLAQAGWWAPVIFIFIYIVATVLFLPGSVFTLAGGVIFGPIFGLLYNLIGATIGAALSFLISRYLASDIVSRRAGSKLKQLINGVDAEGWRFVAFVRLVPLFPFNLLNYALGLTKIRFKEYVVATFVFIIPGAAAYTYIGFAGREALGGNDGFIQNILIALALLAAVIFLPRFVATIRRGPSISVDELKQRINDKETLVLDVRTESEFIHDGHIKDAINITLDELAQQIVKLTNYKDKSISIICKTDKRSAIAANILLKHGFHNVRVVRGGMAEWSKQLMNIY
ncbi:MAG: sulfurtransferase [Gammaproteobacteria bacterium]|nr:MAG: sulfurtransferase [Gammaproteobacteria bacterium]